MTSSNLGKQEKGPRELGVFPLWTSPSPSLVPLQWEWTSSSLTVAWLELTWFPGLSASAKFGPAKFSKLSSIMVLEFRSSCWVPEGCNWSSRPPWTREPVEGIFSLCPLPAEQTPHRKQIPVKDWQLEGVYFTGVHKKQWLTQTYLPWCLGV